MAKSKRATRISRSYAHTQSSTAIINHTFNHRRRYQTPTGSCVRCSGLFIREKVVGSHYSGLVMRCVNCGSIKYFPGDP